MTMHRRGRHRRRGLDTAIHHITVNLWELYYLATIRPERLSDGKERLASAA